MASYDTRYGYTRVLQNVSYDDAVRRTTEALKTEGFGVLTTIDVKATLKQKLDVDFRRYVILGACNPPNAYKALSAELAIGLLLPCNVCVFEGDKPGETVVQAVKPAVMFEVVKNPAMNPVVEDVDARMRRMMEKI
ncbi:MAG: DUF302 domain-containing protein [Myxococcaceae bacterium]